MRKKTKLLKKGGTTFLEKLIGKTYDGSFVADNISDNIKRHKDAALLDEYKLRKEIAEKNYDIKKAKKDGNDKIDELQKERDFKYDRLRSQNFFQYLKVFLSIINGLLNILGYIGKRFLEFINIAKNYFSLFINSLFNIIRLLRSFINLGQGAIVKIIILIAVIIGIGFTIGSFAAGPANNYSILNKPNLNVFSKTPQPSFTNYFNNLIPDSYKFQWNNIKNKFNNAFGYDIKANSINKIKRDFTNDGRNNDLTHVKVTNDNNNVYSILEPNISNIHFEIDLNKLQGEDIDYNKLPDNIKNLYKDNYKNYKIYFDVREIKKNNSEFYALKLKNNDNGLLKDDNSAINHFKIIKNDIIPVYINEKYKQKMMFDYNNDKFVYPTNIESL